jgi:hypothetical protein
MAEKKIMEITRHLALSCHMMILRYIDGSVSEMLRCFSTVTENYINSIVGHGNRKLRENKNGKRPKRGGWTCGAKDLQKKLACGLVQNG